MHRLLILVAFSLAALPARAGDVAMLEILGFSPDGGVFAFEEYGVQDGSGFPYSNRYYLDTAQDRFLPGTPVRARLENDGATVEQARAEAKAGGQAVIDDAVLQANRGHTAGLNPVTELSADPYLMSVNPRPVFPPIDSPLDLRLEEFPLAASESCRDLGETKGFRLTAAGLDPERTVRTLHEDSNIPQSRGCPLGYAIGAVQTLYPDAAQPVFVVLVAVRRFGFEGPDFRWIAVPGRFGG